MVDRDPIEQLKTALRWTADYYDEPMREAGCPCDASSGITCPLHAGLLCADELDALLGSARLQKDDKA
jgi:hypothetical protein